MSVQILRLSCAEHLGILVLSLQVSAITALLLQIKKNWKNISTIDCLQHYNHWPEKMGQKMSPLPRATDWLTLRLV